MYYPPPSWSLVEEVEGDGDGAAADGAGEWLALQSEAQRVLRRWEGVEHNEKQRRLGVWLRQREKAMVMRKIRNEIRVSRDRWLYAHESNYDGIFILISFVLLDSPCR
jgi:hypothetical protein